jgi:hypothetical protein
MGSLKEAWSIIRELDFNAYDDTVPLFQPLWTSLFYAAMLDPEEIENRIETALSFQKIQFRVYYNNLIKEDRETICYWLEQDKQFREQFLLWFSIDSNFKI